MKIIMKAVSLLIVLIISVTCITTAFAVSVYTDGDYSYIDVDQYHVALFNYTGDSSVLTVPAYFSDKGVSQIYAYVFESRNDITAIDFSRNQNQLDTIGTKAFNECTSLSGTLTLPASLRTLGFASFQGCIGLDTLYVNLGIRDIPEQCFNRCSGLKYVYLPTELESIDRLAFANCSYLEAVYIPSSVTYINEYAFTNSDPTLYVYNNSYAHQFAIDNKYEYVVIDAPVPPTEPPTEAPTEAPTDEPTITPTYAPTESTEAPTMPVTEAPTMPVTEVPTLPVPTNVPTESPTQAPTDVPTEAPTQTPTAEPTQQPTGISGYYLGDVNGDNSVTIEDATFISRYLAFISYPEQCDFSHGDVDGDGSITILDATFIMRYLAEMNVPYPINELVQIQ